MNNDPTLQEVLDTYLSTQPLKEATKFHYGYLITHYCKTLLPLKVSEITPAQKAKAISYCRRAGGNHKASASVLELLLRYAARLKEPLVKDVSATLAPSEITLVIALDDYLRSGRLKEATIRNYRQRFSHYLGDWMHLKVTGITKQMVEERHRELSAIGHATADSTFRNLRALLNYAAVKYEDEDGNLLIKANPCRRLTELRQWHKDVRRTSVIHIRDVGLWFRTVWALESKTARDILLILLFTGLRHNEVKSMEWSQVCLRTGTLTIPPEKSKNKKALVVPLSDFVWRLLSDRRLGHLADVRMDRGSKYVFPGSYEKRMTNHVSNIEKSIATVKKISGINFMVHDLRRGFITIADELDLNLNLVKNLVNHANADVTEGYTIRSQEKLRRTTQKITNFILAQAAQSMGFDARQEYTDAAMKRILALPFTGERR